MIRPLVSATFEDRLNRLFDNRVRIRWSSKLGEWHLEYKIAPGQVVNCPVESWDDKAIRARDGYAFIMAVRTGDRMPCPVDGTTLPVPAFKTAEVVCDYCRMNGRDGRYPACYFPLEGDALLTYLCKLDPLRGYNSQLVAKIDAANERLIAAKERAFDVYAEAAVKDNIYDLFNIPRVGYTGKVFTGN